MCLGTACYVKGSQNIVDRIASELSVDVGKTSADGKFTLEATRCIGACGLAPVLTVNEDVYGRLVEADVVDILKKIHVMEVCMKSLDDLKNIRENTYKNMDVRNQEKGTRIVVGMATCGIAAGAKDVLIQLFQKLRLKVFLMLKSL